MPLAPLQTAVQPCNVRRSPLWIGLYTKTLWLMRGSREGDRGSGPPPPWKWKNIGFLSNTGPDPLKIEKLPSQHSLLGHHRSVPVSETPLKWRFAGGPTIDRFKCYLNSLSPHKKQKQKKTPSDVVRVWQSFLDPHMVAYIDDAHVGPMMTTYWFFYSISFVAVSARDLGILHGKMMSYQEG